ncbi:scavenger receptor cysteine-rich type 1 protein M130-like [Garra rufa]|uniref:scavenger receptor cysteine-rich type 1 protein M130-like n=1 Tax=Garra rufa TaxID=137080 RepID=UPI003CCED565
MADAAVVCRELDCGEPVDALGDAHFGQGSGPIWLNFVTCTASESTLKNCGSLGCGGYSCDHSKDAGVICSEVRLVGGSRCSGRLEIRHNQTWMSVCDVAFDQQDAEVVCRELDCGTPVQVQGAAAFGKGDTQMWTQEIQCRGNESQIHLCPTSPQKHNYSHGYSVGLVCADHVNVRLVGGHSCCAGRVEVHHRGQWGTVCGYGWDLSDAAVVCRELDCGKPVDILNDSHEPGLESIGMKIVTCTGSESSLMYCGSERGFGDDCASGEYAGVVCSEVRLVGGSRCSGRLEILHNQTWMSVCDAAFDQQDAEVVCRELDCGAHVQVLGTTAFGKGDAQMWTQEIQCRGNESQINLCSKSLLDENNCSHDNSVGLVCADHVNVRLVGGHSRCAGRVEVQHRGQWGTVCDDGWDMADAAVVCRELDCGEPVDALGVSNFGPGSGSIWTKFVTCTGSESTLKNCGSVGRGRQICGHSEEAGVICSEVRLVGGSRCSGRLEILHDQTWMSVCDAAFDQQDAEVVCRELDCGAHVQVLGAAAFGKGDTQMWTQEIQCRGNESQIHLCPVSPLSENNCSHDNDVGLVCADRVNVRLVGGHSRCAGRVKVLHRGQWGRVCDDGWDMVDAAVVCRELDCGEPVDAVGDAHIEPRSGSVWMNFIMCTGSESTLKKCGSAGWDHKRSRLIDGPHLCSGRLEVLHGNTWYTVCDAAFDQQDAEVVCRELNCGAPVQVLRAAAFGKGDAQVTLISDWLKAQIPVLVELNVNWFGEGSGEIWADVFDCDGNETKLSECLISSWSRDEYSHRRDVGVICSNSSLALHDGLVRLSGERQCEGEVEVFIHQVWRRVLLDSWSLTESSVVCRQLGCGSVLNFYGSSSSSPEHSHECVTGFQCSGSEAHLGNCSSPQTLSCSFTQQLSITCLGRGSIKLVGSGGDCAGRLEVFHSGSWGTVCDDSWDIKDAHVVCRQLQCGVALSNQQVPAWFGPGSGPIWLDEVECEGNETSLWSCSSPVWGKHDCNHKEDVGVVCSEFKEIRLTEGCEGNVEVFYNGSWGNLCHNKMDRDTASMICQELNCGRSGSEPIYSDISLSHNWLDYFKCRQHDSTLWQCPSLPWGQNDCCKDEAAKIICSEKKSYESPRSYLTSSISPLQRHSSDHVPLRLSGGEGRCSGRLEVYHNAVWGSVCDDQWDISDAQVVCRQLGCGAALRADRNSVFGAGEGVVWLNRVECRGNEIHLWDCPLSLNNHTDCSHKEQAGLTCADLPNLLVSSTSVTTSVSPPVRSTSVTPSQTPPAASLSVPSVLVIVLGVVLFLLLVPLLILIQQNRVMRRALSKRRHRTTTEAVYEEIQHRPTRHSLLTQRGDRRVSEITQEYYDDVITVGLNLYRETEDTPGSYDDVITSGQNSVDTPENFYDVIINGQDSQGNRFNLIVSDSHEEKKINDTSCVIHYNVSFYFTSVSEGDQEEYDDVKNSNEDEMNLLDKFLSPFLIS